ncbi:MAG: glycosyltransferase [Polyangiaceae bacterium]
MTATSQRFPTHASSADVSYESSIRRPHPPGPDHLRVAFVADTIDGRLGGGVVAAHSLVAALRERHDVVVVGADATGPKDVRVRGFQLPLQAMRDMQFTMARPDRPALRRAFADADIVHLQFPFLLSAVAIDEARRQSRPVVAAFHVQPENALLNVGIRWKWLSRWLYRAWVHFIFNRADAVICPTAFAKRKLVEHGLKAPAYVVSNGVPTDVRATAARSSNPRTGSPFVILAVGRLAAEKRQDVIIEAVRRSRHRDRIRLVLAGAGPREEALRAQGMDLPNPPEVGFVSRARLLDFLSEADLFVHASEVELEGIAVLEAMSAGVPALIARSEESAASDFALSDDFAFASGDAAHLAAQIDALIENPQRLAAARAQYRAVAEARDFAESVHDVESIYRRVLLETRRSLGSLPGAGSAVSSRQPG